MSAALFVLNPVVSSMSSFEVRDEIHTLRREKAVPEDVIGVCRSYTLNMIYSLPSENNLLAAKIALHICLFGVVPITHVVACYGLDIADKVFNT